MHNFLLLALGFLATADAETTQPQNGDITLGGDENTDPLVYWDGTVNQNYIDKGVLKAHDQTASAGWYPICGHAFWDSPFGAEIICKKAGYLTGHLINDAGGDLKWYNAGSYSTNSMLIGMCGDTDNTDTSLTHCNAHGDPQFQNAFGIVGAEWDGWVHKCTTGEPVKIRVQCRNPGCTDSTAYNYNDKATEDDGSCTAKLEGCMDPEAANYAGGETITNSNSQASAKYLYDKAIESGCEGDADTLTLTDCTNTEWYLYFTGINCAGDGVKIINCDSVSLIFTENFHHGTNSETFKGAQLDVVGVHPLEDWELHDKTTPLNFDGANFYGNKLQFHGWHQTLSSPRDFRCSSISLGELTSLTSECNGEFCKHCDEDTEGKCPADGMQCGSANVDDGSCVAKVEGCMDSNAANYNAAANVDDGLCQFPGCMNPAADNYDADANVDNGLCLYNQEAMDAAVDAAGCGAEWDDVDALATRHAELMVKKVDAACATE